MTALALAALVQFTMPTTLSGTDSCGGTRPLPDPGTLTARLTGRYQSPFWPVLADEDRWRDAGWWNALWPVVKANADRRWQREALRAPGVRDTMAVVPAGAVYVEVDARRRVAGARWSCRVGIGVGP